MKIFENGEISLVNVILFLTSKGNPRLLCIGVVLGGFIGGLIAFTTPKEYTSYVSAIPQNVDSEGLKINPALGNLAGISGMSFNMAGSTSQFPLVLYPNIIGSKQFKESLLNHVFDYRGNRISFEDYLIKEREISVTGFIAKVPWYVIDLLRSNTSESSLDSVSVFKVDKARQKLYDAVDKSITISVDNETMIVSIYVSSQDPMLSLRVLNYTTNYIENFVKCYSVEKQYDNLRFLDHAIETTKVKLDSMERALVRILEGNQYITSNKIQFEISTQKSYYNLLFNTLQDYESERNQVFISIQKDSPTFVTLNPPFLPLEKSFPNRILIVIIGSLVILSGMIFYLLISKVHVDIKDEKYLES